MSIAQSDLSQRDIAERVAQAVLLRVVGMLDPLNVVIGVSNRHIHLSQEDLATLFGQDEFTFFRQVRQPGEFAAAETMAVYGPRGSFHQVRAMGPCRAKSQVELSRTDCIALGINAPVVQSGHLDTAAPIDIEGPKGRIHLEHAAMVAARHMHCGPSHAEQLGVKDQDMISFEFGGLRGGRLDNVIVRIKDNWVPELHLDTDEANALGVRGGNYARIVKR